MEFLKLFVEAIQEISGLLLMMLAIGLWDLLA